MVDVDKGLTPKQQAFVEHVIAGESGHTAAIKAGYSPTSAYSMATANLKIPAIKKLIVEARVAGLRQAGITRDYLISKALEIIEEGKDQHKVQALKLLGSWIGLGQKEKTGDPAGEKKGDEIDPHTAALIRKARLEEIKREDDGSNPH